MSEREREREHIRMEQALFAALESCPGSIAQADTITDPEFHQRKLRRFYVLCQSTSAPGKKDLLANWALILFNRFLHEEQRGFSY